MSGSSKKPRSICLGFDNNPFSLPALSRIAPGQWGAGKVENPDRGMGAKPKFHKFERGKMNAKQKIQEALKSIMDDGEARACQIFKGYEASTGRSGWHYIPFGGTARYLGHSLNEALDIIEADADSREYC